jgi:hypothetical protein
MKRTSKINQRDYRRWVVVDGKIESGWEYPEDAKDQLTNLPPGKKGKILGKPGLRQLGLDPDDDNAWHGSLIASANDNMAEIKVAREMIRIAKELMADDLAVMDTSKAASFLKQARWHLKKSREALWRYKIFSSEPIPEEKSLIEFQKALESLTLGLHSRDN